MSKFLTEHNFPEDLRTMDFDQLELLSYELRDFLIESVSKTGGHLASNLGIVELTIALHRCFDTPRDKIIWDVGHQSYVHKILTGRAGAFNTLRRKGGLSGFPRRCESEFDLFDSGHSSTSISLGLGLAAARDLQGEDYHVVSVYFEIPFVIRIAEEVGEGIFHFHRRHFGVLHILNMNDCGNSFLRSIGEVHQTSSNGFGSSSRAENAC